MIKAKVYLGWYLTCKSCRAVFYYIASKAHKVKEGKIIKRDKSGAEIVIGTVKCPQCHSDDVESLNL